MRSRCHNLSLLSLATASMYLGQVLLLTLHFLSVDHSVVTRDGIMGHGGFEQPHPHECHDPHDAQVDARAAHALASDSTPNHADECLYLRTLLRSVIGVQRPNVQGIVCKGLFVLQANFDPHRSAVTTLILVRAPKHSPPATA